jgi:hypothetical protein
VHSSTFKHAPREGPETRPEIVSPKPVSGIASYATVAEIRKRA